MVRDGGVIADGYHKELDELRALQTDSGTFLAELEQRERARTDIPNLRVAYNNVHGFYIEITNAHADKTPADYRRRQTDDPITVNEFVRLFVRPCRSSPIYWKQIYLDKRVSHSMINHSN